MRKGQRYRYEMFVRTGDFGTVNLDLFPASSTAGQTFAQVTAAVTAIEEHLTKRDRARVEARRVKATTRAAVVDDMKTIARTARRVTKAEPSLNPFVLPTRETTEALLSKARLFIDEAKPREAAFVDLGLPATFISEFRALVDQLAEAVNVRLNGRALRLKAQTGIETALGQGFEAIRNLDVLVPNVLRHDPVRLGHWRGARHVEGLGSSSSGTAKPPVSSPVVVPVDLLEPLDPSSVDPATVSAPARPPAAAGTTMEDVVPAQARVEVLRRAS